MNNTLIAMIKQVIRGNNERKALKESLPIKDWQFNENLRELERTGYLASDGIVVNLPGTGKGILLRAISQKFDIAKILRGSNERVLCHLTKPQTVFSLKRSTGLSRTVIYRAISDLQSIGAIKRDGDGIRIDGSHEKLMLFAEILKAEAENGGGPNVETIFRNGARTLKKIPKGSTADGEMTGFSLYSDYGVEYHTTHDYYVRQDRNLQLEDVLIHSVCSAYREMDKSQIAMCMVFYLKNREKMDTLELRRIAAEFKVASVWIDVEGYLRNNEPKNCRLFLPKDEFAEKASLYDIAPDAYTLPEGYPKLFEDIGVELTREVTAYLIGGENMRIKGLKPRTKDCDVVVESNSDYDTLVETLTAMGYSQKGPLEFAKEDLRIWPSTILTHPKRSRIDLYTKRILRTLSLSENMIGRAHYEDFQNMRVGILRNEDVFLLKSVTSREGDIHDMAALARNDTQADGTYRQKIFDWNIVWDEIIHQGQENRTQDFTGIIKDNIELLIEQTGITPPFHGKLLRHVADHEITRLLRERPLPLIEVVGHLEDSMTSGHFIRSRVDHLVKSGMAKKTTDGNLVLVHLTGNIRFPGYDLEIDAKNMEEYLKWRFPMRQGTTPRKYKELAEGLTRIGLDRVGQVDEMCVRASRALQACEETYFRNDKLRDVGALRICVGLSTSGPGTDCSSSEFYVINHKKFRGLARS